MRVRTEAKREVILRAARQQFLQHGYAKTSMDGIAATAGISKQTIYSYYATKETLFVAAVSDLLGAIWTATAEHQVPESRAELREYLFNTASTFLTILMQPQYLALLRILIAESTHHPELAQAFRNNVAKRTLQSFSSLFKAARANGVMVSTSPLAAARLLLGGLIMHVLLYGLLGEQNQTGVDAHTVTYELVDECISHGNDVMRERSLYA